MLYIGKCLVERGDCFFSPSTPISGKSIPHKSARKPHVTGIFHYNGSKFLCFPSTTKMYNRRQQVNLGMVNQVIEKDSVETTSIFSSLPACKNWKIQTWKQVVSKWCSTDPCRAAQKTRRKPIQASHHYHPLHPISMRKICFPYFICKI